ncbi:hypothetical protein UPYG_G00108360 [Umbra pygmaea]|uniref:Ig-like domain-containing protein n=1 Tax=Umbra pygmaea TaxID=75934 RepID=A0ABD0X2I0_UMBPY
MDMIMAFVILPVVVCTPWHVEYQPKHVCTVRGSTIVLLCTYKYPVDRKVEKVMWGHGRKQSFDGPFIYENDNKTYKPTKFEYLGNREGNCSLKIHRVEPADAGEYAFRFETNKTDGLWTGQNGPQVTVSDMIVSMMPREHGVIKEGETVKLTCVNNCTSEVVWFKNTGPLQKWSSTLLLSNISIQDSGNYSCGPKDHNKPLSDIIQISVEYEPKNTSISVRPTPEVTRGTNVTLTCSSNANPTVDIFLWFKIDGDSHREIGSQAELHFKDADTDQSGKYFCVGNKHGRRNSTILTLKVKDIDVGMPAIKFIAVFAVFSVTLMITWCLIVYWKKNAAPKTSTAENFMAE